MKTFLEREWERERKEWKEEKTKKKRKLKAKWETERTREEKTRKCYSLISLGKLISLLKGEEINFQNQNES